MTKETPAQTDRQQRWKREAATADPASLLMMQHADTCPDSPCRGVASPSCSKAASRRVVFEKSDENPPTTRLLHHL